MTCRAIQINSTMAPGASSTVSVQLVNGLHSYNCAIPTISASNITRARSVPTAYSESIACTLPANLPAASYSVGF